MAAVSGSTKPDGDVAPSSPRPDGPSIAPLILDPSALPRALHDESPSGLALARLCDRLAAEIILRHAVGRSTLDLGHGAPSVAQWVRPRASSLTVVDAVDLGRRAEVRLPWQDGTFECVYSLRTLPHLGHDANSSDAAARSVLTEVARVLVPGGVAVCQIDNPRSLWGAYHGIRHPSTVIERGPLVVESERGLTRFDTLPRLLEMLPDTLTPSDLHGLRVFTAWPRVLDMPWIGRTFARLEWFARDRALLRGFGAHLLVVLRRTR